MMLDIGTLAVICNTEMKGQLRSNIQCA